MPCDGFELLKGTNEGDKTRIVVHTEILVAIRERWNTEKLNFKGALSRSEDSDGWWRREDASGWNQMIQRTEFNQECIHIQLIRWCVFI